MTILKILLNLYITVQYFCAANTNNENENFSSLILALQKLTGPGGLVSNVDTGEISQVSKVLMF